MMRTALIALGSLVLVLSCRQEQESIYLSVELQETSEEYLILHRSSDRYSFRSWTTAVDTAKVSSTGEFYFSYRSDSPDFYQVTGSNGFPLFRDVFLEPGDSLHVLVPTRSDTTPVRFAGARENAYRIYDQLDSLWNNDPMFQKGYYEIAQMQIDTAWEFLDTRSAKIDSLIDKHFEGKEQWSVIELKCRDQYKYRAAKDHYDYLYYHKYYTQDTFLYLIPEESYYNFLSSIDIKSVPDHFTYDYMAFISGYLRDHFQKSVAHLPDSLKYPDRLPLMFNVAVRKLQGEPQDWAFLSIASEFSQYLGRDDFFELADSMEQYLITNHTSDVAMEAFVKEKLEYENLRPGNPAPDFALPNVNGDTVQLSDLKGKVVYLDFWGTWCYPCLQEMPSSLELEEKLKDEAVEFVYVGLQSGGDQLKQWKDFVTGEIALDYAPFLEQRAYPGIHLVAEGQFNNPSLKPFKLRMAPTYMLIDAEGQIVTADAPRPSSDEIEGLIREVLLK